MRLSLASLAAALVGTSCALVPLVPAQATDSQVTVRGAGFPQGRTTALTMVGCDDLYDRSAETLAPYIGIGPGRAPLGERSLGYDLAGGNAVGSLHYVDSMRRTSTAALSVHAAAGASGVAYAGFQDRADAGTQRLWIGRAPLSAAAGTWSRVEATTLSYSWTQYDMVTHQPVAGVAPVPASTVAGFAAAHGGDGAGFYTIGFGCDGAPFNTDAWTIGGPAGTTRYDLEGLDTVTSITGSATEVRPGQEVTLRGQLRLGRGDRMRSGTLMLEARPAAGGRFRVVEVVDAAASDPAVVVRPERSTVYRWRFAGRPMAEASESSQFTVTVVTGGSEQPPPPEMPPPSPGPAPEQPGPSPQPDPEPTPDPDPEPAPGPAPGPAPTPGPEPTPEPEPTPTPTPEPTPAPPTTPAPDPSPSA